MVPGWPRTRVLRLRKPGLSLEGEDTTTEGGAGIGGGEAVGGEAVGGEAVGVVTGVVSGDDSGGVGGASKSIGFSDFFFLTDRD